MQSCQLKLSRLARESVMSAICVCHELALLRSAELNKESQGELANWQIS